MKKLSLLLLLAGALIWPLRVHAVFERAAEKKEDSNRSTVTAENTAKKSEQAAKDADLKRGAGEIFESSLDTSIDDAVSNSAPSEEKSGSEVSNSLDQSHENELTLDHFRTALDQYPEATRLVIVKDGGTPSSFSIKPGEAAVGNRSDNIVIINALRDALEKENSPESRGLVSQVIGQNNLLTYANSHLSAVRLREVLRRFDEIKTKISRVTLTTAQPLWKKSAFDEAPSEADQIGMTASQQNYIHIKERTHLLTPEDQAVVTAEKEQVGAMLHSLVVNSSQQKIIAEDHYKEADQAWHQALQAWKEGTTAEQDLIQKKAKQLEKQKRHQAIAARKKSIEELHPPISSFDQADWQAWATHLIQAGGGDLSSIALLADHSLSAPIWAMGIVNSALEERTKRQQEQVDSKKILLEEEKQKAVESLQKATQRVTVARQEAIKASQRLEAAREHHQDSDVELEKIRIELDELRRPENATQSGNAAALTDKLEKFDAASTKLDQFRQALVQYEEASLAISFSLANEETNALSLRDKLIMAEKMLFIHQERTADHQEKEIASQPIFRLPKSYHPEGLRQQQLSGLEPQVEIRPPEILMKLTETMGKALLREARRIFFATKESAPQESQTALEVGEEQPNSEKSFKTDAAFIPEIRVPTDQDRARWKASQAAHELIESRNKLLAEFQASHPAAAIKSVAAPKSIFSFATTKFSEEEAELNATGKELSNEDDQKLETYSTTSFAAKKNHRSESLYSRSTAQTRSSLASSRDSYLSGASALEKKRFQAVDQEVSKAADAWIDLVRRADAERIAAGGLEYANDEALFKAWQETDEKAQAAEKEQSKIEEELLRAQRMQRDWEENTARWEAREKADRLAYELEMAKLDLTSSQGSSEHVTQIEEASKQAKREWKKLALSYLEKENGLQDSEFLKKEQIKQLKEKDRAINKRWEEIKHPLQEELDSTDQKSALNQGIGAYHIDLMVQKGKDLSDCFEKADKANIKAVETQKKVSRRQATQEEVERLYEEAEEREQKAVEKYRKMVMKEALRAAWEQVAGAESAWESRVTKAQRDQAIAEARLPKPVATTILREAPPTEEIRAALQLSKLIASTQSDDSEPQVTFANMGEFLNREIDENILNERRAAMASKTLLARRTAEDRLLRVQTSAEALLKTSQEAEERRNPLYQAATRLASIAEADRHAFEVFKCESKEITDIIATWKTQLEREKKAAPVNLLTAALSYAQNKTPWELLSPHERTNYNEAVLAANEDKEDEVAKAIAETTAAAQKAQSVVERYNKSLMTSRSSMEAAQKALEKAEFAWAEVESAEDERERALRWIKLTPEEKVTVAKAETATVLYGKGEIAQIAADAAWYQAAALVHEKAIAYWEEAFREIDETKAKRVWANSAQAHGEAIPSWDEAIETTKNSKAAWNIAAEAYQRGYGLFPDPEQLKLSWITTRENAENNKALWAAKALYAKARKRDATAWMARDRVLAASHLERAPLWDESLRATYQAEEALDQTIAAYKEGLTQAPERLKDLWNSTEIENKKAFWEIYGRARLVFGHAEIAKTEIAWIAARDYLLEAERALEQVINKITNHNTPDVKQFQMQHALFSQQVKKAHAKAVFVKAREAWTPFLELLRSYYLGDQNITVDTIYDNDALINKDILLEAATAAAVIADVGLRFSAVTRETAATIADGAVFGGSMIGGAVTGTVIGAVGGVFMPVYVGSILVTTTDSDYESIKMVVTQPRTSIALSILSVPFGFLFGAGIGVAGALTINSDRTSYLDRNKAYDRIISVAIDNEANTIAQVAAVTSKILNHTFFKFKKIPSTNDAEKAAESPYKAGLLARECIGTSWEEEASWLVRVAKEIRLFNKAVIARGK